MKGLHFAEPQLVHLVWLVLLAGLALFLLERRGGRALQRFVAPGMQDRLVAGPTALRRGLRLALQTLAGLAIVVALMRPQWGVEFVSAPQVGAELMIALDVSRSMLAEDVAPNRLDRAKAEIRDLLAYLDGDQVGLIAFAGRASVLSPLTPDFGFLRLVLDDLQVGSVRPGGTRLEEPIRKAVAGFGAAGDLSRVILLITDGEDHDSFPLDAAKVAAERGIRILAIGFGDEDGSEIVITDEDSGARTVLLDADGRPVQSRLDGELLRELAVVTEGAYVPAGTGVLDLESIFEAHIRPLMRATGEERGRTIHKDAFQWAILVALVALLVSVSIQGGRASFFAALLLAVPLAGLGPARAQAAIATPSDTALEAAEDAEAAPDDAGDARPRLEVPADSREAYNRGLEALQGKALDDAERLLEAARSGAKGDAEVRFRATFNLAWVEVLRADAGMEDDPSAALRALGLAADWLREAVALRPASTEARRNLEIVLERELALADSLAAREPRDVAARLEELIEGQRGVTAGIRPLAETVGRSDDANAADRLRPQFKQVAVEERRILSEAGALADLAGAELDSLENRAEEELTPEDQMRTAQLGGVLHYVHRARERIGQARSQLRRRQAARAHLRAAAGLSQLQRARAQLQDPVRVLDGVIGDATGIASETRALAAAARGLALDPRGGAGTTRQAEAPAWLTPSYLAAAQGDISERTLELNTRLEAGLEQAGAVEDPAQQALLEQLAEAQPFVQAALSHFERSGASLETEEVGAAVDAQAEGIVALIEARERFLDMKGLIEVAHADQQRIASVLEPHDEDGGEDAGEDVDVTEYGPALVALQRRNLERASRLDALVRKDRVELEATRTPGDDDAAAKERGRAEAAQGILAMVVPTMRDAGDSLATLGARKDALAESRKYVETARRGLEVLRRLYFSIVEHIRDAAERQVELADGTEAVRAEPLERMAPRIGPLAARQGELGSRTEQLADALHQQSFADPAELIGEEAAMDEATAKAASEKLTLASELVLEAGEAMKSAAAGLTSTEGAAAPADEEPAVGTPPAARDEEPALGTPPAARDEEPVPKDFEAVRQHQDLAVQKLSEALAMLQPPQDQNQNEDQEQNQEQEGKDPQQGEDQGDQAQDEPAQADPPDATADPSQILQAVRDHEAERRRRRGERRPQGYDPVEKDW